MVVEGVGDVDAHFGVGGGSEGARMTAAACASRGSAGAVDYLRRSRQYDTRPIIANITPVAIITIKVISAVFKFFNSVSFFALPTCWR